jgi:WD40 repeat protein/serine/threonine protein kinase
MPSEPHDSPPDTAPERGSGTASGSGAAEAEVVFEAWLDALEKGESADFEALLTTHPALAPELRRLQEQWRSIAVGIDSGLPDMPADASFFRGEATDPASSGKRLTRKPGDELGDYRLRRPLGQGAVGEVWEADELSLGRRVALKLLRPEKETAGRVRLLAREARAGGRMHHPGIVTVYAAGEVDGTPFIAQQLVGDGFTLADFITRARQQGLPPPGYERKVADLFQRVAEAVAAAHAAGILHRDIKPSNILIGPDDQPRVGDFGLAHLDEDGADGSSSPRPGLIGTAAYMSPEQVAGDGETIDGRSDVFSLGAVLYEALTLRRAFEGDDAAQVLRRVVEDDPPDPRTLRARLPSDLAVIILKALEKNRAHRYASMSDLADDLRRFLAYEPIHAAPPGALGRLRRWTQRHPALSATVSLLALSLVVISVLLVREIDLRQTAADNESLATQRADETAQQSYLANIRAAALHIDRGEHGQARRGLAACPPDLRRWEWEHLALRADTSVGQLLGHADAVTSVVSSRDGSRLVTGSLDGTVKLWDAATGAALATFAGHDGAVRSVALAGDGHTIVSGGDDGTLRLWDGATGVEVLVSYTHGAAVRSVAISRDGNLVASGSDDGTARVLDRAADEEFLVEPRFSAGITSVALSADGTHLVTASRYGTVRIWGAQTAELLGELPWEAPGSVAIAVDAAGEHIYTGGHDGALREWTADGATERVLANGDGRGVLALAVDDGSTRLVIASPLGVHLLPLGEEAVDARPASLTGHEGSPTSVAISGDGRLVAAGCADARAVLWDGDMRGASVVLVSGMEREPTSLAASSDGALLATASLSEWDVRLWDGRTGEPRGLLIGHAGGVTGLALSADGRRLASGSYDGTVRVWDTESGQQLAVLLGHADGVSAVATDAAGGVIISGSHDGTVRVWRRTDADPLVVELPGTGPVSEVCASADGTRFAAAGADGSVSVIEPDGSARRLTTGEGFDDGGLGLSADGHVLVWAAADRDALIAWDLPEGEVRTRAEGLRPGVVALEAWVDGSRLAVASWGDATLNMRDTRSGETVAVLAGHTAPITALAVAADAGRLVSASADGTLRSWETRLSLARDLWAERARR